VKVIAVDRPERTSEKRYELVERKNTGLVLMRVLTQPAGQRLIVYARGPEWTFNDNGRNVKIRYYGLFKDFCLQMARHWSKPISSDFRQERTRFPDNHSIWNQSVHVPFLPYLERPQIDGSGPGVNDTGSESEIKGTKSEITPKDRDTTAKLLKALIAEQLHHEDKKKYPYTRMDEVTDVKTNDRTLRDYRKWLGKSEYASLELEARTQLDQWVKKRQKTAENGKF
jgi:hypothetical protein